MSCQDKAVRRVGWSIVSESSKGGSVLDSNELKQTENQSSLICML